jgi:phosphate transport system permease protein
MSPFHLLIVLLALSTAGYYLGRRRAFAVAAPAGGVQHLHSLPSYYGALTALWCGLPALLIYGAWLAFDGAIITNLVVAGMPAELRELRARNQVEKITTRWRQSS